jgi:two-component system NtrC family response regulator
MPGPRVLVVDDDDNLRRVIQVQLQQAGHTVSTAASGVQALEVLSQAPQDLVITDLRMSGMSGVDLLKKIRADYSGTPVILITAFGTIDTAVEAIRFGAYDYVTKPVNPDALRMIVQRALEHLALREEVETLRRSIDRKYGFDQIIGDSNGMLYLLDTAARAAQSDTTVLIYGETGTGKELLARAIHANSARRDKPFVTINCGAIPRELLESELFGHVKGSFTGAVDHKKGRIELAHRGTLFLDEIGDLPTELQVKLLRLLQEHEIAKIGRTEPINVDVRIISATHRNLLAMVAEGTFREDLYYRLNVIPLQLPPLRDRIEDIPGLVQHFFAAARKKHGRVDLVLPDCLLPYFQSYRWPGNIRELENAIERLVVLSPGQEVSVQDLPEALRTQRPALDILQLRLPPEGISLESLERELIVKALELSQWNQTRAARYLDLSRKTLIYRMEKYGIRERESGHEAGSQADALPSRVIEGRINGK